MEQDYQSFKEELKQKADLLDIVEKYAPVVRRGANYFAPCPLHADKTPSFCINPRTNTYKCFGCGKSGDVINFVQEVEKVDYTTAVEMLAKRYNMVVPTFKKDENFAKDKKKRDRLYDLMRDAARHYHNNLMSDKGKVARDYLANRGIDQQTITNFGLGYSINSYDLPKFLKEKGYTQEEMNEAKVAYNSEKGGMYDPQHERFIIPVLNNTNNVIAFCGRIIRPAKDNEGKYYNSMESFIFHKSNELFGQHIIKKLRNINDVILVEGHMDVISLYQAGIQNAVASMGTALTSQQAHLIRKQGINKVYFMYDGDGAGQKGMARGVDILRAEGLDVKVVVLEDNLDPDEYIKKFGAQAMRDKIYATAIPMYEYKINNVLKDYNLKSPEERGKFAEAAINAIKDIPSLAQADPLINIIEAKSGVPSSLLYELLKKVMAGQVITAPIVETPKDNDNYTKALRFILYAAYGGVDGVTVKDEYSACFRNPNLSEIYDYFRENPEVTLKDLEDMRETNPEANAILNEAKLISENVAAKYFNDSRKFVLLNSLKEAKEALSLQLKDDSIDTQTRGQVLVQLNEINIQINEIKKMK